MSATAKACLVCGTAVLLAVIVPSGAWAVDGWHAPSCRSVGERLEEQHLSLTNPFDRSALLRAGPGDSGGGRLAGRERKNPMLAVLMSAILPGWGEFYAGHPDRGRAFMAAEAAIWVGYAAFTIQGSMRTDDYKEYARVFAGVGEGVGDQYYEDIADYIRSEGEDSYNEAVRREARSLYPDDLDAQRRYLAEHGYFGEFAWEWETEERFDKYRDLRHDAAISFRNAFYMTGLAILNRAVSAIDGAWMVRRQNQGLTGAPGARLSIAPDFSDGSVGGRAEFEISF